MKRRLTYIAVFLILVSLSRAERDYLLNVERDYFKEIEKLPKEKQETFAEGLTENELLEFGNQCYVKGLDGYALDWCLFFDRLQPMWKKHPPKPEKYLSIIKDERLHPGFRTAIIESMSVYSNWDLADWVEYIDFAFGVLKDPHFDKAWKWPIPSTLNDAVTERMACIVKAEQLVRRQKEVDALHEKSALFIEYMSDFLASNPDEDVLLLEDMVSALAGFVEMYGDGYPMFGRDCPPSASLNKAKAAREKAIKTLGLVLSKGNYPSRVVIDVLRATCKGGLPIGSKADIESLRKSKTFSGDPKARESLEYWVKNLEKKRGNLSDSNDVKREEGVTKDNP